MTLRDYINIYIIKYKLKKNSVTNTMWNKCCGFLFLFHCCCCCYFIHGSPHPPPPHFCETAEVHTKKRPGSTRALLWCLEFIFCPWSPQSSQRYSVAFPTFRPMTTSHSLWQSIICLKKKSFCIYSANIKNTVA